MPEPRMKQRNASGYIEAMRNRPDPYLVDVGMNPRSNPSYPDPADYGYEDNQAMAIIKALFADPMDAHRGMSAVYSNRNEDRKRYEAMMEQARAMAENARLARQYGQPASPTPSPTPMPPPSPTPIGAYAGGVEELNNRRGGLSEEEYNRMMNGG